MKERSAYLVYRIETRKESSLSGIRKHVRGGFSKTTMKLPDLHQMEHGTPGGAIPLRPSAGKGDMRKWRREAKAMKGAGRPPDPWCEAVFVGRRIIDWKPAEGRRWADACVNEFERLMPNARIVEAQLHTREAEWHVHIVAQPRGVDALGRMRCSKNAMIRQAIEIETGEPPPIAGRRGLKEHGEDASALQSAFHRACGEPFGLLRGEVGSKAKHTEIDEAERAQATAREVDEVKRRLEAELTDAIDFKAEREAVEKRSAELDKRERSLLAARAKIEAGGKQLEDRIARYKNERAAAIEMHKADIAAHAAKVKADKEQLAKDAKGIEEARIEVDGKLAGIGEREAKLDDETEALAKREAEFEKTCKLAYSGHSKQAAKLKRMGERVAVDREALNACIRAHEAAVKAQAAVEAEHAKAVAAHEADVERDLHDRQAAIKRHDEHMGRLGEKYKQYRRCKAALEAKQRDVRERETAVRAAEAALDDAAVLLTIALNGPFGMEAIKDALFATREGQPMPTDVGDAVADERERIRRRGAVRNGLRLIPGGRDGPGGRGI